MRIALGKQQIDIETLPVVFVWVTAIWSLIYWQSVLMLPEGEESAFFVGPLSWVLVGLAVLVTWSCTRRLTAEEAAQKPAQVKISRPTRNKWLLIAGLLVFTAVFPYLGAIPGGILFTLLLSFALGTRKWYELLLLGVFVAAFSWGVYVKVLMVPLPLWPAGF